MNSIRFDPISPLEYFILLLVILAFFYILYLEPKISRKKLKNKNEHGSSKFADMKEIKTNFDKETLSNINKVGFPIWYEKVNGRFENVYFDNKSPHFLLVGSTGSGKSVTVSIPLSIHFATAKEKHSIVITDPKGELFRSTGKIFEENGYDIITIDFRNPAKSNKINIMQPIIDEWKEHCRYYKCMMFFLSHFIKINKISMTKMLSNANYVNKIKEQYNLENYIIDIIKNDSEVISKNLKNKKFYDEASYMGEYSNNIKEYLESKNNEELIALVKDNQNKSSSHQAETNRLIISLSNLIFTEKDTKDPYWINASKQLFIGIVGIFIEDYKSGLIDENKISISSVKKFQNSSLTKENQSYLQKNLSSRQYGSLSKDYLTSIISASENTYKSITAVFGQKMSIFDDLNVENITSTSEFKFTNVAKKPTALYIIVPDEDRAYFQLVTIIIGMLIKDLTKFANIPSNNGVLPIKVEWILDEFANCPPLDAIETVVSVARSRGMRFYFFIQSFSQLDQVYGKEIANIIQDNCALVYLKTNTVETAEIIAKKLGKATIETNSMSMSTDPFKIGANETKSLMGKELLTTNEIIGLKYKTIIFPTFGNPIFRDTYMYSDLYPKYVNYPMVERETKILKRVTDNYYTVEKLRQFTEKEDSPLEETTQKFINEMNHTAKNSIRQTIKSVKKVTNQEVLLDYVQYIRRIFKDKITGESIDEDIFVIELSCLLSRFEIERIRKEKPNELVLHISPSIRSKKTILAIWYE